MRNHQFQLKQYNASKALKICYIKNVSVYINIVDVWIASMKLNVLKSQNAVKANPYM